jgi:chromosome segregation ATPase
MNAVIYYLSEYADALDQGKAQDTVSHSKNLRDVVQLIISLTARAEKAEAELAQAKERVDGERGYSIEIENDRRVLQEKVSELEDDLNRAHHRLNESEGDAEQMEKDLNFKISELEDLLAEAMEERE